jgi:hypothetical protein
MIHPLFDQSVLGGSALETTHVLADEAIPLVRLIEASSRSSGLVGRSTRKLPGPLTQASLDVAEGPVPIDSCTTGCRLLKSDPLVVTESGQSLNMTVVTKPAPRNDVMVKMRKSHHQLFDPNAELVPLSPRVDRSDIRPIQRAGCLLGFSRFGGLKQLVQRALRGGRSWVLLAKAGIRI